MFLSIVTTLACESNPPLITQCCPPAVGAGDNCRVVGGSSSTTCTASSTVCAPPCATWRLVNDENDCATWQFDTTSCPDATDADAWDGDAAELEAAMD